MNLFLGFTALGFSLAETWYFGWNWTPQSDAEMICDGIGLVLLALAVVAGNR